ncbi:unnamed protein product, partial [marine sediment metagenome]
FNTVISTRCVPKYLGSDNDALFLYYCHHTPVGLNHEGYLPEFVTISEGKTHDVIIGRTLKLPKGSIVAIDRGYNDYAWYNQLTEKGIFFVTRLKSNAKTRVVQRRPVLKGKGLTSDQTIEFAGIQTSKTCPI